MARISIEQTLTQTHEQQRKLLDFFQNKQKVWNENVQEAIDKISQSHYLPLNLIPDMFLTQYDEVDDEESYDTLLVDDLRLPKKISETWAYAPFRPRQSRAGVCI